MKQKIGIYLHIPFCIRKCPYCDFTSFKYTREEEKRYVDYLIKEIEIKKESSFGVETIYLGGGTPSLLSLESLSKIFDYIYKNYSLVRTLEISIEANPGTITKYKLKGWKDLGINRVSLGVQSFVDRELKLLGRIYNSEEIYKSYFLLRDFGFGNINFDIIYAIPFQTFSDFEFSLKEAVRLSPEHISLYNLTIEPETVFYEKLIKGEISLIDEEKEAEMFSFAIDFLHENKFIQYEISNFSMEGKYPCKHNLKYWKHEQYLGFGVSAYSLIFPFRYGNYKELFVYYERIDKNEKPIEIIEYLEGEDLIKDAIFVGLRLMEGIDLKEFKIKYNRDLREFMPNFDLFLERGLLNMNNNRVSLSKDGILLANEIFKDLF